MKTIHIISVFFVLLFFSSCGVFTETSSSTVYPKAELGSLADADVKIYEFINGEFVLKWEENTTDAKDLKDIGKFKINLDEIDPDKYYLIKVTGGKDWDSDDNGIKDVNYTENNGTIRALATGYEIIKLKSSLKVTYLSELLYEQVCSEFNSDFNETEARELLQNKASNEIEDLNKDGIVNNDDILLFDPVKDKDRLMPKIKNNLSEIVGVIKQGGYPLLNSNLKINIISDLPKDTYAVKFLDDNKTVLLSDSNGMSVADISDIYHPKIVSELNLSYGGANFEVSKNNIIYLADYNNGIQIIDYNTTSKKLQSVAGILIPNANYVVSLTLSKDQKTLYVPDKEGIQEINVTDPYNPVLAKHIDIENGTDNILISEDGTKLYAFNYFNMYVIDITNPSEPLLISSLNISNQLNTDEVLLKDGKYIYVGTADNRVFIVNIEDAYNPSVVKGLYLGGYVDNFQLSSDGKEVYLLNGVASKITVLNVTDPETPEVTNTIPFYDIRIRKIYLNDVENKIFATSSSGVYIVDLNHLINLADLVVPVEINDVISMTKSKTSNKLYLDTWLNDFQILDLSKIPPETVSEYSVDDSGVINSMSLSYDEKEAFLLSSDAVSILDISDDENIRQISKLNISDYDVRNIAVGKTRGYISAQSKGILVFDITDLQKPEIVEDFNKTVGSVNIIGLSEDKNTAYVLSSYGLEIYDVTSLTPVLLGDLETNETLNMYTLSQDGKTMYALSNHYLYVVNIADPEHPELITAYSGGISYPTNVALSADGSKLFLTTASSLGLEVLNISDLKKINIAAYVPLIGRSTDIEISNSGDKAYVSFFAGDGIYVLDLSIFK